MSPIARKLQIKPNKRWLFFNAPENYLLLLEPLPDGVITAFEAKGNFDGVQLFIRSKAELVSSLSLIHTFLKPDTIFWVTYPKKSSGIKSDLEMMGSWDEVEKYGFTGVAAAAINETWTALRFRPKELSKVSEGRNSEIKTNEYAAYIDVDNKQITLPSEITEILQKTPQALGFYNQLSYSNRKEYVLWILTAKQEKTRNERLVKMVEKLLTNKKNPFEK